MKWKQRLVLAVMKCLFDFVFLVISAVFCYLVWNVHFEATFSQVCAVVCCIWVPLALIHFSAKISTGIDDAVDKEFK